jgi:hypothetical protein
MNVHCRDEAYRRGMAVASLNCCIDPQVANHFTNHCDHPSTGGLSTKHRSSHSNHSMVFLHVTIFNSSPSRSHGVNGLTPIKTRGFLVEIPLPKRNGSTQHPRDRAHEGVNRSKGKLRPDSWTSSGACHGTGSFFCDEATKCYPLVN